MKETISYDYFSKLDVRVGTICVAEIVFDADKLLRLEVDFGEDNTRQIISGVREYFPDPSVLVGTQTTFVVNLEPRLIRGLESNGMLFAISGDEGCVLLRPEEDVVSGAPLI